MKPKSKGSTSPFVSLANVAFFCKGGPVSGARNDEKRRTVLSPEKKINQTKIERSEPETQAKIPEIECGQKEEKKKEKKGDISESDDERYFQN